MTLFEILTVGVKNSVSVLINSGKCLTINNGSNGQMLMDNGQIMVCVNWILCKMNKKWNIMREWRNTADYILYCYIK